MEKLMERAIARAQFAGAEVKVLAMAALRATREAEALQGADRLPCIIGIPLAGERLEARVFDGEQEVGIFPGDLPANPAEAIDNAGTSKTKDTVRFVRFRPPDLAADADHDTAVWPHIRLDRALEFLIGDRLT